MVLLELPIHKNFQGPKNCNTVKSEANLEANAEAAAFVGRGLAEKLQKRLGRL